MPASIIKTETRDAHKFGNFVKGTVAGSLSVPFGAVALPTIMIAAAGGLAKNIVYKGLQNCGVTTDLNTNKPIVDKDKHPHLHKAVELFDKSLDLPIKATNKLLDSFGKAHEFLGTDSLSGASHLAGFVTGSVAGMISCTGAIIHLVQRF